jgi:predicted negative regulator of RcsB-dependent stress response
MGLTRKQIKHDEFIETAQEAGQWLEENWKSVAIVVAVVIAVILAGAGIKSWLDARAESARIALADGQTAYREALNPADGETADWPAAIAKLDEAVELGGKSETGLVAQYFRGLALMHTGDTAGAVGALEISIASSDALFRQTATVALARAAAAGGDTERAASLVRTVVDDPAPVYPPDQALMVLGELYAESGDLDSARSVWTEVMESYPDGQAAGSARSYLDQ